MNSDDGNRVTATVGARDRSVAELVRDATDQVRALVRDEMQLAAIELRRKGKRFGAGAGLVGGAGVLGFYGGAAILAGVVLLVATVLPAWIAAMVVGGAVLLVAAVLALVGKGQVEQAVPPVPQEAAEGVQRDIQAVREGVSR
jgi:membrane protein